MSTPITVNSNPELTQMFVSFGILNGNELDGDLEENVEFNAPYFNTNIDNIIKLILYNRHSIDNFSLYKVIYNTTSNECEIDTWDYPNTITRPTQAQLKSYSRNTNIRIAVVSIAKSIYMYNLMRNATPELKLCKYMMQYGITATDTPFEKIGSILNPSLFPTLNS